MSLRRARSGLRKFFWQVRAFSLRRLKHFNYAGVAREPTREKYGDRTQYVCVTTKIGSLPPSFEPAVRAPEVAILGSQVNPPLTGETLLLDGRLNALADKSRATRHQHSDVFGLSLTHRSFGELFLCRGRLLCASAAFVPSSFRACREQKGSTGSLRRSGLRLCRQLQRLRDA